MDLLPEMGNCSCELYTPFDRQTSCQLRPPKMLMRHDRLLFQPFKIRGLTLKNRLVVPPMVHYRAEPGSTCGMFHNVHLGRYALGGFGLVFVEATGVEEVGLINEHDLGIWNEAQAQSFKPLIAFMKRENTAIGIQLAHGGRKSSSQSAMDGMGPLTPEQIKAGAKLWQPVGPTSEPVAPGWLAPRQLTTEECRAMVKHLGQRPPEMRSRPASTRSRSIRPMAICSPRFFRRFPTRAMTNMAATATGACGCRSRSSRRCGAKCRTRCRCSCVSPPSTAPQDGWNLDDTVAFAHELKARGVDVVDCSSGGISGSATAAQVPRGLGFQVPYAERVRKEVGIATMAVGIILEAQQAEAILENGQADLIAVGRQSQFNPNIAHHWAHDLGINAQVRGLDARIWLVAREANPNHGRVRHADRGRQATR